MDKVIVSLTTYPARIKGITRVLDSVMQQTYKPDKIVLYLSEEQFAKRELPVDLSVYFEQGLEIHWCSQDMKSHKKYLYVLREYPNDYVITIDDDFYYEEHMVEELVQYIHEFPGCILARRTHLITSDREGRISDYEKWWSCCTRYIEEPRMNLCAIGCGGILYPPHILTQEVFNVENIKQYCMYADDIWLKIMELISDVPVVQIPTRSLDVYDEEFAKNGLYQQHNGEGGNDQQLRKLLEVYGHYDGMEESLADRIFSSGIVYEDEVSKKMRDDDIRTAEDWVGMIGREKSLVIYGAGTVAKRIYGTLKRYKIDKKIKCFAVENTDKNNCEIGNIDVAQYKRVDYTDSICVIALADIREQYRVKKQLLEKGLQENQILLLNSKLNRALREIKEGQQDEQTIGIGYRSGI